MVSWILSLITAAYAQMMPYAFLANQPATLTFVTNAVSGTDASSTTFSGTSFGPAHHDRYLLIGVNSRSGSGYTINSVTVAGQAATLVHQTISANTVSGFYIILAPTGTSGTVTVAFSGSMVRTGISVYQVRNLKSTTAVALAALNVGNSHSTTIDVPARGFAVAVLFNSTSSGSPVTNTWSGATKDFDTYLSDTSVNGQFSGASMNSAVAITAQPVSATSAVYANSGGLVISMH